MYVAFRHLEHSAGTVNTLMSLYTNSKFTHAQIIFSNREIGGAWMNPGVVFKSINDSIIYPWLWSYIDINCSDEKEQLTYDFIKSQIGKPFDSQSYILTEIIPFLNNTKSKWFCSKIVFEAFIYSQIINKNKNLNSNSISPQKLYNVIIEEGYGEISLDEIRLNNILYRMVNDE